MGITRDWQPEMSVNVAAALADCQVIEFVDFAGMAIHVHNSSAMTEYHIYGAATPDGEYGLMIDEDDNILEKTGLTTGKIYRVRPGIHPLPFVKILANATTTVHVYMKG